MNCKVSAREIRFHYGYPFPRKWTEGCFVLSSDYSNNGKQIQFSKQKSINAVQEFDYALGGGRLYNYSFNRNGKVKTRKGAKFDDKRGYSKIKRMRYLWFQWSKSLNLLKS